MKIDVTSDIVINRPPEAVARYASEFPAEMMPNARSLARSRRFADLIYVKILR